MNSTDERPSSLPAALARADAYRHAFDDLSARTRNANTRNHVLIVDDNEAVASALRALIMENCPGAAVVCMTDPEVAARAITNGHWAVVIADVSIGPRIHGGALAEMVPRTTDVFLFTGHDIDTTASERALRLQETLRKPLSAEQEKRLIAFINGRMELRASIEPNS